MKKVILVLFVIAGFVACVDEGVDDLPQQTSSVDELPNGTSSNEDPNARKSPKIDICHKGDIINVSANSIEAHQGHGDAIDMDGDGYFDIDNVCSETDCDDNDPTVNKSDITISEIRLGGELGDSFIGPRCNENGTYRTCFYISASEIPESDAFYQIQLNGVEYPVAAVFEDGPFLVLCATDLPTDDQGIDVLIQLTQCGSSKVVDLYDAPLCEASAARLSTPITKDSFRN